MNLDFSTCLFKHPCNGRKKGKKEGKEWGKKEEKEGGKNAGKEGRQAGKKKYIKKEERRILKKKKVNCKMMHFGYDSCKKDNLKLQLSPKKTLHVGISISKYWQINGYACDLS